MDTSTIVVSAVGVVGTTMMGVLGFFFRNAFTDFRGALESLTKAVKDLDGKLDNQTTKQAVSEAQYVQLDRRVGVLEAMQDRRRGRR